MASIYSLKPAFQNLLRPITRWLAYRKVSANQVTIAAVILSILAGAAITLFPTAHWPLLLVAPVLFVRMVLNAIDGMLAREHHMQSPLGTFLNELGDVLSDTFLYLPFALIPNVSSLLIIAIVIASIISEMKGVVATQIGAKRRYDGPMGKSDRAFVFGTVALLLGCGIQLGIWVNLIFLLVFLALIATIKNRIMNALKEAAEHASSK